MNARLRTAGRNAALRGGDALGRATSRQRVLPDFVIVGGQRCGTTTLFKTLTSHPSVLGPTFRKGVHFFDLRPRATVAWYRSRFPTHFRVRRVAAKTGAAVRVGESSPYYMWHPLAPERIARTLPDAKILMLLRDPVERAYSAHAHEFARGFESADFTTALSLEPSRLAGQEDQLTAGALERSFHHQHHAYVARGEYIDQLLRLEKSLGREQLLVIDSQDFWSQPELLWPGILDFLELPDHPGTFERHNARSRAPMSDGIREQLSAHFEPFDERLTAWWGQTPSWRR